MVMTFKRKLQRKMTETLEISRLESEEADARMKQLREERKADQKAAEDLWRATYPKAKQETAAADAQAALP